MNNVTPKGFVRRKTFRLFSNNIRDYSYLSNLYLIFRRAFSSTCCIRSTLNPCISLSSLRLTNGLWIESLKEGVETEERYLDSQNTGCNLFQGYYFSKPLPVEDFEKNYIISGTKDVFANNAWMYQKTYIFIAYRQRKLTYFDEKCNIF